MHRRFLLFAVAWGAFPPPGQAQQVSARVVDEVNRQGLRGATVVATRRDEQVATAETDPEGFFTIAVTPGEIRLRVSFTGVPPQVRDLVVSRDTTLAAFVLSLRPVELDPVEATTRPGAPPEAAAPGFQRASHRISADRLRVLEQHGGTPMTAIRELGSVRVYQYVTSNGRSRTCVESNRRMDMLTPAQGRSLVQNIREESICSWIIIAIDDIVQLDPERTLRSLHLSDFERIEYLAPPEAGFRYGLEASSVGAIVFWTRRGR